jgi:tetratricopeptide (TPR) repeat protein
MRSLLLVSLTAVLRGAVAAAQCTPPVQQLVTDQRFDAARADVQATLRKNASDDAAMHCMGIIAIAMNNPGDAVDWFEKSVKANDKSSLHHLWLGNALGEQASHTSKIKLPFLARRVKSEFEKAAQLDPASIDAKHGLIQFYTQAPGVMGGDMNKARDIAREIGKLNAMRGHLEMAAIENRDKNLAAAEKEFAAAVAASPDSTAAYNGLGSFLRGQKRYAEAIAVWERLLKARPDVVNAHINIGVTYIQSGQNLDRAEQELKGWLAAPPKDASKALHSTVHYWMGALYEKTAKKDAARGEYQTAVTLNPNNGDAKKALDALK